MFKLSSIYPHSHTKDLKKNWTKATYQIWKHLHIPAAVSSFQCCLADVLIHQHYCINQLLKNQSRIIDFRHLSVWFLSLHLQSLYMKAESMIWVSQYLFILIKTDSYHIRRCLVPLNDRDFAKLGGDKTKVIFILYTFTFKKFRVNQILNLLWLY